MKTKQTRPVIPIELEKKANVCKQSAGLKNRAASKLRSTATKQSLELLATDLGMK